MRSARVVRNAAHLRIDDSASEHPLCANCDRYIPEDRIRGDKTRFCSNKCGSDFDKWLKRGMKEPVRRVPHIVRSKP